MSRHGSLRNLAYGFFLVCVPAASSVFAGQEFIIKLRDQHQQFNAKAVQIRAEFGLKVLDSHEAGQLVKVELRGKTKETIAKEIVGLLRHPDVEYVVPDVQMHAFNAPNDPQYQDQWSHQRAHSEAAWAISHGSKNVVVAVIDTGVDYHHEDLAANIWKNPKEIAGNNIDDDNNGFVDDVNGWDFKANDNDPMDETSEQNPGHGTHCSGIVGAVGDNGVGVSGMSQSISIMPIRFLGADGSGDLMAAAKAIDYAVANNAQVISASWGAAVAESGAQPIIDAIGRANTKGVIFVAAAANDGKNNDSRPVYPANTNFPNMISVAASQSDDTKPSWSNFGITTVHLASPGHEILSTLPQNKYGKLSGTSMATPMVAGLVGLMLSATDVKLSGLEARSILQSTGEKVAIETACDCRIDAGAALASVQSHDMTVVPNAVTLAPNGTAKFSALSGTAPFTFSSTNADVAAIDAQGTLTAKTVGETTVVVTGADQKSASSLRIRVAEQQQAETCPLGDEMLCMFACLLAPELPWCAGQ